jgi:putative transposase
VESACAVLEISPSTYYAAKKREEKPSARGERDEELKRAISRARGKKGRNLYGSKKMWRELNRDGIEVARCTVERLMPGGPAGQEEEAADHCARSCRSGEAV